LQCRNLIWRLIDISIIDILSATFKYHRSASLIERPNCYFLCITNKLRCKIACACTKTRCPISFINFKFEQHLCDSRHHMRVEWPSTLVCILSILYVFSLAAVVVDAPYAPTYLPMRIRASALRDMSLRLVVFCIRGGEV